MRDIAIGTSVIRVHRGDITMLGRRVGAIVNATNEEMRPTGGVSAAIHEFGGPDIAVECLWIGRLDVSRAVATTAGRLLADHVIHVFPPVWDGGGKDEDRMLAAAYRSCLQVAEEKGCRSIAFPSLGGGLYGFPFDRAAAVAIGTAAAYHRRGGVIEEIMLVAHDDNDYQAYDLAVDRWERMQLARARQAQAVS
jgi:O-acetyl-ADP-ribose deacetylase (regulator of RNase III)